MKVIQCLNLSRRDLIVDETFLSAGTTMITKCVLRKAFKVW